MLSLPLIPPRPDASLWPSHRVIDNYLDTPASNETHNPTTSNGHRHPNSHHTQSNSSRNMLSTLVADENNIYQRKQNVRRFGAGWIRPPGVAKTLQAKMDEDLEREEQEILVRREQALLDLAAAQVDAANREAAAENHNHALEEGERDLDDEVPEAEIQDSDLESNEEDTSELEEGNTSGVTGHAADMTFNEDSFIEGSMVQAEVQHMLEREEAEMAGVLQDERDLDDDIPEAGSYEHTDTELDSSDAGETSLLSVPSVQRRRSGRRSSGLRSVRFTRSQRNSGVLEVPNHRSSFGMNESSLDGSSFLRSSPVAARGSLRSRLQGAARGQVSG